MYNKQSCRECGAHLTPHSLCAVCKEHIGWVCGQCGRVEDSVHVHDYCRLAFKTVTVKTGD